MNHDEEEIDDFSSDEEEGLDGVSIAVVHVHLDPLIQILSQKRKYEIIAQNHNDPVDERTLAADIVILECRVMDFFSDLKLIRQLRSHRPLMPLITLSKNLDLELMSMAFNEGASDFLDQDSAIELIEAKITSFHKIAKATKIVEIQNEQLISTMQSLRKVNEDLRQEAENRAKAEAERDLAGEMARMHQQNKEILDNLTSGFFIINKDLTIDKTTSKACERLFLNEIAEKSLGNIFNLAPGKEDHLRMTLEQLFENIMPFELNFSLLKEKQPTADGRIIHFHFNPFFDEQGDPYRLIVVATDITEMEVKQAQMQEKVRLNQVLLKIISEQEAFQKFLDHYREELQKMQRGKSLEELTRSLHTLKGNCASFGLETIAERIHKMENTLPQLKKSEEFASTFLAYSRELEWLMRSFLEDNKSYLHIDYSKQAMSFKFDREQIIQMYQIANQLDKAMSKKLTKLLDYHRLMPISVHSSTYEGFVSRLAKKLGKKIRFHIRGQELRIQKEDYDIVFENLIHALSNACDHGIEDPLVRHEFGKDEYGEIILSFSMVGDSSLQITLSDDGAGVDTAKLTKIAVEKGIVSSDELKQHGPEGIMQLIFHDGLSTAQRVSEISGRGVGMPALKQAVEKLGGEIVVKSEAKKGSTMTISIPGVFIL